MSINPSFRGLAVASLASLAACGSPAAPRSTDMTKTLDLTMLFDDVDLATPFDMTMAEEDLTSEDDLARPPDLNKPYPPAPYGNKIGDTFALVGWEGYVNPTANGLAINAPYRFLTTDQLHGSGKKFGLLYAADPW